MGGICEDIEARLTTFKFIRYRVKTDTANEILGKYRPVKKPLVTTDILDLCAKRRKLKN